MSSGSSLHPADPDGAFVFLYGSNMLGRRLRARTPSAFSIAPGEIRGHRMAFHKLGADGSAKANILGTGDATDRVFGVVYRIERQELEALDAIEGGYDRNLMPAITRWGHAVEVHAYLARPSFIRPDLLPFAWYRDLVVAGAREHRLPAEHVLWLECHAAHADPDQARRAAARADLDRPGD